MPKSDRLLALLYSHNFLFGLTLVTGLFISVALHELGHSIVALRKGSHVHEILLTPIGGVAKISNFPSRPTDEIQLALAGPAVSLILGIIGVSMPFRFFQTLGVINLVLALFNLLPCFPMDGGRVFRAYLSIRKGRLEGTRLAVKVGTWFCVLFVVVGLLQKQPLLVFIGFYIWQAGRMEYRMILLQQQTERFNGHPDNLQNIYVSPPPYATQEKKTGPFTQRWRNLFRRFRR